MPLLPDVFSVLILIAGWFYLFYSGAAKNLENLEGRRLNIQRVRLRRVGGLVMILLGVGTFVGFNTVDDTRTPQAYFLVWIGVMFLLLLIVLLGFLDLRLTYKLRRHREKDAS